MEQAIGTARSSGDKVIALTFDKDPDEMFHPDRLKKLMSNEARLEMLASLPIDYVVVLPFTKEFAAAEPWEFLDKTFKGNAPAYLHIGYDFKFGKRASGRVDDLRNWAALNDMVVCAHDLKSSAQLPVSATRIRLLLAEGNITEANRLLTRRYFLDGEVRRGRGEGAGMGFCTANLQVDPLLQALADGVYAGWAIVRGERYKAAISVGVAPTFKDKAQATCEVHILDFIGDVYGERIRVEFDTWLRPMMEFETVEQLVEVVQGNIAWVRDHLH